MRESAKPEKLGKFCQLWGEKPSKDLNIISLREAESFLDENAG